MIENIGDLGESWSGRDALWFECTSSDAGSEITLYDWDLTDEVATTAVIGGTEINGPGCMKFAEWEDWAPNLMPFMKMGLAQVGLDMPDFENIAAGETFS